LLSLQLPSDIKKLQKQKEALEWQLTQDTNEKDRIIHEQALKVITKALQVRN
jgi:hypothetical protein